MSNVILYMAMSVNGMVAREDGKEDFLSDTNWETFAGIVKEHGNLIIGRKTYETVKSWGEGFGFDDFVNVEKVVISRETSFHPGSGYSVVNSPKEAVQFLSEKGFETCLVAGGPTTNALFAKEGLLDEIILNIEPALIGKGIPLFAKEDFDFKVELVSVEKRDNGILSLHYRILK